MSRNTLTSNNEFHRGDYLLSNNRQWKAVFQDDGNFVIYGWSPVWSSDTASTDATRLCMQGDCNLVMYNKDSTPRWHTNSAKSSSNLCRLVLRDDGKLVLQRDGEEIWNSATSKGMK